MTVNRNHQWILAIRPAGQLTGDEFSWNEAPIPEPADGQVLIRMLIAGYVFAIQSERQLCREVQVNLAYRWFCDLDLEDPIPDHSAFSRARNERFRESDMFRRVFERVVGSCIVAGLVGGEGFAVDASLIEADANRQRSIAGKEWHKERDPQAASRAVKEYLPMQAGDVPATFASVDRLAAATGFAPTTPIAEGLARFVAWYRQYYGVQ